jgi:hypothetical protein
VNLRSSPGHRLCYPFEEDSLRRIAYFLDCDPPTTLETARETNIMWNSVSDWKRVHEHSSLIAEVRSSSLTIHDRRHGYPEADYHYEGLARDLYLAADAVHSESSLIQSVLGDDSQNPASVAEAKAILREFLNRDLMLREDNFYLSLALLPVGPAGIEFPQAHLTASAS